MIHSSRPTPESPRNPSETFGRTGHSGIRHVDMEELLEECVGVSELEHRFRLDALI